MDGIAAYRENQVVTQSPGRLIVMLYEGAIRFCRRAIGQIEAGDPAGKHDSIRRAQDILDELNASLNTDAGGEIATNLRGLYQFMHRHLDQADLKQDPKPIEEVIRLLEDLNEAWKAVAQ